VHLERGRHATTRLPKDVDEVPEPRARPALAALDNRGDEDVAREAGRVHVVQEVGEVRPIRLGQLSAGGRDEPVALVADAGRVVDEQAQRAHPGRTHRRELEAEPLADAGLVVADPVRTEQRLPERFCRPGGAARGESEDEPGREQDASHGRS
jgi:hypothetical protein